MKRFQVTLYSNETEETDQMFVRAYNLEDAKQTAFLAKCDDEIIVRVIEA